MSTLHIRQDAPRDGGFPIRLTLKRNGQPDQDAEAKVHFALTESEQEDLRWYLEDYLQRSVAVEAVTVQQVETLMRTRGEELYTKVLDANANTQALWFSIRNDLADLRVEIATGIAEAASIPWELMRDPTLDSSISLRVKSFVRVQSNPSISFVSVPPMQEGRIRLLYIACRPDGVGDVPLRAVANRLLQDLGECRARFDIKALRPPTFEQLQNELANAKAAGRPYHIVHFDGHGGYADKGYLFFEHPGEDKRRPVDGQTLGQLLHDNGVPILVLNACQSAMHNAVAAPQTIADVHEEIRAIGSLAQAVVDQGIPAVLGMRYSVYVVTAAQYIGKLYAALAKGRGFGEAATEGRKHLYHNPERWAGLQPRPLQDWLVPIVYEAVPIGFSPGEQPTPFSGQTELDPVQGNPTLLRYVPQEGFIGRDETLLALDRAFDRHRVVLLHAYAGQGKSSTAVEFARWYSSTGGLGKQPRVFLTSFQRHTDLTDLSNQIGQIFAPFLESKNTPWSAVNDPGQRRQLALQLLREFPMLWIWDNIEPVAGFPEGTESQWTAGEQDELRDFLHQIKEDRASRVKILLTSRRDETKWLGGIPYRIAMPPMSDSDAAKLALKLGEGKKLNLSELADWQPLLNYCSGNPLTLRILILQAVKAGVRGRPQFEAFVEGIRSGEQGIEDDDAQQGRDKSLGASLDYGFRQAFKGDELPIIALLHLFQGSVNIEALHLMGEVGEHALPELKGRTKDDLFGLLERAKNIGHLTHLHTIWYSIHPALPWFLRQHFARHYDGQSGRSTAQAALRAWTGAVGALGNHYHNQFSDGNRSVIDLLELEEANLLHARRLAIRHGWSLPVTSCMQGLRSLYEYQTRLAEWARLVEEIKPNFCTTDDEPILGCEEGYGLVLGYRISLARMHEYNLPKVASLQMKAVQFSRIQASRELALSADAPLDSQQRQRLHTLGVNILGLAQTLCEEGNAQCIKHFLEAIQLCRRIAAKSGAAVVEFNLGRAFMEIPTVRDLDAAEAAYRRAFDLCAPNDFLGRSRCIHRIGAVHHERFRNAQERYEPIETLIHFFDAAKECYLQGLQLCPKNALADLAPMHGQLGLLFDDAGQLDGARLHHEQSVQYFAEAGNHLDAGYARLNMALTYARQSERNSEASQQCRLLFQAQAYATAALRDFQRYQGRAGKMEAQAQNLLDRIRQELAKLPT